jgi:hypothetical protein
VDGGIAGRPGCAKLAAEDQRLEVGMAAEPKHSEAGQPERRTKRSRARVVKPGRMPVSEFAFDRAGAGSPFGDDLVFPLPVDSLHYDHPEPENDEAEQV